MSLHKNHPIGVIINSDIEKRIVEAFQVYDYAGNQVIDVREVSTVIYSLGCVPTKSEIEEIIKNVCDPDSPDKVYLVKFLPVISGLISKYRFHPATAEELLNAFRVLDQNKRGYLEKEYFSQLMFNKGESFNAEELNSMLAVAVNLETDNIPYEFYINHLIVD